MTTLSALRCEPCRAYHLTVAEPFAGGQLVRELVQVPFGSFHEGPDPLREAWIRVEAGRALKGGNNHGK